MKTVIDRFQGAVSDSFRQLILAIAYLNIGTSVINTSPGNASVELRLDKDIKTEPFYLKELLIHSGTVEQGVLELCQNKMVAAWSDLLGDLFSCFVDMHFSGIRKFRELKKRTVRLDFSLESDLNQQIRVALAADFAFQRYAERLKIIDGLLNPDCKHLAELTTIKKHVFIRNAVQHHAGKVYGDMLRELGCSRLTLLDGNADIRELDVDDFILLSVPELDTLKRGIYLLSNEWRKHCG
jgi:hypothetical protein